MESVLKSNSRLIFLEEPNILKISPNKLVFPFCTAQFPSSALLLTFSPPSSHPSRLQAPNSQLWGSLSVNFSNIDLRPTEKQLVKFRPSSCLLHGASKEEEGEESHCLLPLTTCG